MLEVSEAYRAAIQAPVRTERVTGTLALADGTVVALAEEDLMSGSLTLDNQCVSGEELQFGCVYLGQAALRLRSGLSRYKVYGAKLTLDYSLLLADGSWQALPLGVYTVSEAERSNVYLSIKAYDNMLALDKPFDGEALQGTAAQILAVICEKCGLALGSTAAALAAMPNGAEALQIDRDSGCTTFRDCVAVVAQLLAAFATVNRAGALVLRGFGATVCTSIPAAMRSKTVVADYRCSYRALTVEGDAGTFRCAAEGEQGLEMQIDDCPIFNNGLPARCQQLAEAMFAALQTVRYTPATVTMPGDPSLECGDLVALPAPGEADADAPATLVTHWVWRYRGRCTVKGVGRNPYLAGAKSRTAATLRQLQAQSAQNRTVFLHFANAAAVQLAGGQAQVAAVEFAATEATSLLFLAQVLLDAQPTVEGGTVLLQAAYFLDGVQAGFAPAQVLLAGQHSVALFYPLADSPANSRSRFSLRMQATGGQVTVGQGACKAALLGQGLAAAPWDGSLQAEDALPAAAIGTPPALAPGPVAGEGRLE